MTAKKRGVLRAPESADSTGFEADGEVLAGVEKFDLNFD